MQVKLQDSDKNMKNAEYRAEFTLDYLIVDEEVKKIWKLNKTFLHF